MVEASLHVVKFIPHLEKGPPETIRWRGARSARIFLEKN